MTFCTTCALPSLTQFASPGLVESIVEGTFDRAADPAWETSGASTVEDYAFWCGHLCGMTCLRMALGPDAPSLFDLRDGALKYGAYTVDAEGDIHGLIYAPFAEYAREELGLDATVHRHLTVDEIAGLLDTGRTVMASVHYGIRRPERPAPGRGGHLVLVTASDGDRFHFHNPSGISRETRCAELPLTVFETFFASRGVSLGPGHGAGSGPGHGAGPRA
ncbi:MULTISPECIES: peptidase [unclassified Streptomyces]|uniref:peptidase n=1 Tax=unclassified Streptomyces TaxID=2593676 RepID=UPI0036E5C244